MIKSNQEYSREEAYQKFSYSAHHYFEHTITRFEMNKFSIHYKIKLVLVSSFIILSFVVREFNLLTEKKKQL